MKIGHIFWILWIVALIFGGYVGYTHSGGFVGWFGGSGFMMVLTFLLGVGTFGWPIQGGASSQP